MHLRAIQYSDNKLYLKHVQKEDINSYKMFFLLANKVWLELSNKGTRDINIVEAYFKALSFTIENYPINQKHFGYIKDKTNIDINFYPIGFSSEKHRIFEDLSKYPYAEFIYNYRLRPFISIFAYPENLQFKKETVFNIFSKPRREQQEIENFEQLKNLFWFFVDEAKKQLT